MARWKVTLNWSMHAIGASETYITRDTESTAVTPLIQKLIDRRNDLLFNVVNWQEVRISLAPDLDAGQTSAPRRSAPFPPGTHYPFVATQALVVPGTGARPTTAVDLRPDQARAVIQIRTRYDTDRYVVRYFCYPPDGIMFDEVKGIFLGGFPDWTNDFNNFVNMLVTDGWSLRALRRGTGFDPIPIRNWVQSSAAPTNIGFVLPSAPPSGIVQRDFVRIKDVRRRGTDRTSYNGRYIIDSVNTSQVPDSVVYYLRGTETGDPASIKLLGTVQRLGYRYFPILGYAPVRPGVHKRGRAAGVPHGRRQNRISLDP